MKLAKGYTCKCGKENFYPSYVYAHWNISLTHTCDCGRKYNIFAGTATLIKDLPVKKEKQ